MATKKTLISLLAKKRLAKKRFVDKQKYMSMYTKIQKSQSLNTGYVNLSVDIENDENGNERIVKIFKTEHNDPYSISIFIAGGKNIDKKVARANSRL